MVPGRGQVCLPPPALHVPALWRAAAPICENWVDGPQRRAGPPGPIRVFLADDNLIVREGVRALIDGPPTCRWSGWPPTTTSWSAGPTATRPQVLVTDIRMPPTFTREGIDAAKEVRKRHPGTGVVVLSQYDDPEYAVSLLAEGSAGYGYLLKDHVAEGNQLVDAIRAVATGGTALDPSIVEALVRPVVPAGGLSPAEEELLAWWRRASRSRRSPPPAGVPPEAADAEVEAVFVKLAEGVSAGSDRRAAAAAACCTRPSSTGRSRARRCPGCCPAAWPRSCGRSGGTSARPSGSIVTVLMSDIRSYSTIAEHADPSQLAGQLNTHRAAMNQAILGEGGTVMQFVGDAVMAVFGAPFPQPDHADRAVAAAAVDARPAGGDQQPLGRPTACPRSGSGSGCPPARPRRPCSARRSGWNTRWSATP